MAANPEPRLLLLPRAQQRVVPWRNGGGETREVAIEPPGAAVTTAFRWRVSLAKVGQSGPFSQFPGVDRILWLVRGAGMVLSVAGREVRLDTPFVPFAFAGETPITAQLLDGPNEDLNVMVDRARASALADVHPMESLATWSGKNGERGETLVLALAGSVTATMSFAPAVVLAAGDAMRVDIGREGHGGDCTLGLCAGATGATVLVAHFLARGG